ncbi:hypothetical protein ACLBXX_02850 [Microbacterium sp. C23T]
MAGKDVSRKDFDALANKVNGRLDAAEKASGRYKWIALGVSLIVGLSAAAGPVASAIGDATKVEPVMCTDSYERVAEMHKDGLVPPSYPDQSQEQQQCDINGYIEGLD